MPIEFAAGIDFPGSMSISVEFDELSIRGDCLGTITFLIGPILLHYKIVLFIPPYRHILQETSQLSTTHKVAPVIIFIFLFLVGIQTYGNDCLSLA